jgi:hypothetical protein
LEKPASLVKLYHWKALIQHHSTMVYTSTNNLNCMRFWWNAILQLSWTQAIKSLPLTDTYVLEVNNKDWIEHQRTILAMTKKYKEIWGRCTRFVASWSS